MSTNFQKKFLNFKDFIKEEEYQHIGMREDRILQAIDSSLA